MTSGISLIRLAAPQGKAPQEGASWGPSSIPWLPVAPRLGGWVEGERLRRNTNFGLFWYCLAWPPLPGVSEGKLGPWGAWKGLESGSPLSLC